MANPRVQRGRGSEEIVAQWYRERGWPRAERVPASIRGKDIRHMKGLAPEVKARADFNPLAWTRQAVKNADYDEMPFVVMRCNGQGEAQIGEWLVIRPLYHDTELLLDAEYGPGWRGRDCRDE